MKKSIHLLALAGTLALPATSSAIASNPGVEPNEWRLLPRLCLYVEGGPRRNTDPVTVRRLIESDPTWYGMHHYCWAIVQEARTFRPGTSRNMVKALIDAAITNLNFILDRSKPGFEFRPDMFVRKARLQARRGLFSEAAETARQLIAESPELPEGYISLADVQIKAGHAEEARVTLERGEVAVKDKERFQAMKAILPPH